MVLVRGLDRTDDNESLFGMPDDLWREHTEEIRSEFDLLSVENKVTFKEFCMRYFTGERTTQAMRIYAEYKRGNVEEKIERK